MATGIEAAKKMIEAVGGKIDCQLWVSKDGKKVRVYLAFPRGYKGGAGGGKAGYVDFSRAVPEKAFSFSGDNDLFQVARASVAAAVEG